MEDAHDDGHGDEDNEDHGEEHGEEHGDEHDDHAGHGHASPMETISNLSSTYTGCPTDYVIVIYELEKGDVVIEFEAEDDHSFDFVVLKMGGGHAHHHHGHGDGPFEWAGIFEMNDASHTWSMQKVGGSYAETSMRLVLIPTDTPDEATMHSLESGVEDLIEGDCQIVEDGETMQNIASTGTCFELHVGEGNDSTYVMNTTGITGLAIYAEHVPTEFERDQHYLKNSTGGDIEPVAQEGGGAHGHGEHGDNHGDEHGDEHGDHDDHWEPNTCHDEDTHETHDEYTNKEDCEAAGHMWMEDNHSEEEMTVEGLLHGGDTNNDSHISWEEFSKLMENDGHDHQDGDHNDGHHDDNESNHAMEEAMEDYMMGLLQNAFNESDMYYYNGGNNDAGDGLLNYSELEIFVDKFDHVMEDIESASTQVMISLFDEDGDGSLNMTEFTELMEVMDDDHDDDHGHAHDDEPGVHHHGDDNVHHEHNDTDDTTHGADDRHHSHDEHDSDIMVCYDWSTGSINSSYNNQGDCSWRIHFTMDRHGIRDYANDVQYV